MKDSEDLPLNRSDIDTIWETFTASRFPSLHVFPSCGPLKMTPEACQRVDEELKAMQMVLCAARTRRNAVVAAISRLPPEVLSNIFFEAQSDSPRKRDHLGWINVSHVCRQWRAVALTNKTLWLELPLALGKKWIRESLLRAPSHPRPSLVYSDRDVGPIHTKYVDAIHQHLGHARHLHVVAHVGFPRVHHAKLLDLCYGLTFPVPYLETLAIKAPGIRDYALPFPLNTFGRIAPRLRSITTYNVSDFPWKPRFITNLVHLDIAIGKDAMARSSSKPSLRNIVKFLRKSPTLQYLSLVRCIPRSSTEEVARLPNLAALILGGSTTDCLRLVKCLRIPRTTKVHLRLRYRHDRDVSSLTTSISNIFTCLTAHLTPPSASSSLRIDLRCDDQPDAEEDLHIDISHVEDGASSRRPSVSLSFNTGSSHPRRLDIWRVVIKNLPVELGKLKELSVVGVETAGDAECLAWHWTDIAEQLNEVRQVHAEHDFGRALCQALSLFRDTSKGTGWQYRQSKPKQHVEAHAMILPRASRIEFGGVDLTDAVVIGVEEEAVDSEDSAANSAGEESNDNDRVYRLNLRLLLSWGVRARVLAFDASREMVSDPQPSLRIDGLDL
ncbi:hypothetical protein BV25DRAFT_1990457 [Artomyces pyxidatus]|uniref:Uncharacterized protein n=1 Tax=Artomyces pyxidatus TaxID=48021 RepID=A0ACB8T546_9AGAM|nr:hypothetical protein BV25DRAFT_1990457 [Artomyces pyxidatus]